MKRVIARAVRSQHRFWSIPILLLTALLVVLPLSLFHFTPTFFGKAHADTLNPIQIENNNPGTPDWNDFSSVLQADAISGYGSKISVNHGETIDFYVTTTASSVSIDIFRTGWYGGVGARKLASLGTFTGVHQPMPTPDPKIGIIVCNWSKTTSLTIPQNWVTGVYLAKLTASSGNQSFIFFVVRNDGGHEDIQFQTSVTTYQAYNTWGGTSLYNNNTDKKIYTYPHAMKVSFDRPFNPGDSNGAGHYFFYEYKFVRWIEAQGYNVSYITDIDTHSNVNPLTNHKAFLSVGHDEYWSKQMRDNVESAIKAGVNVGFFSANTAYWQIRLEPNAAGAANRIEVGYKDFAAFTDPPGPDPQLGVNNAVVTTRWRDDPVNKPENALLGVMFEDQVYQDYAFVVQNASHWVYAGTGFVDGSTVPGIVGYEYDKVWNNGQTPQGLVVLSNSPVTGCCGAGNSHSNATLYTAASGARVFAAGTIQWSWGLNNTQGSTYANAGIQRMTANILNNFISGQAPDMTLSSTSLDFGNQNTTTTSASKAVTLTNSGTKPLTISSIAMSGTNASDFAQTNNCPASTSTLAVGSSCTVNVTFTPPANGNRTATLTITHNGNGSPQTVALSGTGTTPAPGANVTPTSLSFGNQSVGTTSGAQNITLKNDGTKLLTISSIAINGTNASDFTQTNTCSGTLAAGSSCAISVTFKPPVAGSRTASLAITDDAAGSPQTVSLSGTGVVQGLYFTEGFESGNFSKWTFSNSDSTGKTVVQKTVVNSGSYAAAFSNTSGQYAYTYTAFSNTGQPQTFTRLYFRVTNAENGTILAVGRATNGGNVWEIDYNNNRHGLDIYFWHGNSVYVVFSPQNVMSANTWYAVEVQVNEATTGHAEVWLNGTSVGTIDDDLSSTSSYGQLMLYDNAVGSIYFDDVVVANTYNGQLSTSAKVQQP